jgi:acetyl-CoA carboxylase biotin carboxyl carrier protein
MNLTEIKRLVKLVEASNIEELEIQEEGFQIRIMKGKGLVGGQTVMTTLPSTQQAPQMVTTLQPEAPVHEAKIEPTSGEGLDNTVEICSPIVGTFYRAPAPDADPYVDVGDEIHPKKILCIIEAMKLMNEIEAEISGKIVKILVENAQPVEYNQPLFLIEIA